MTAKNTRSQDMDVTPSSVGYVTPSLELYTLLFGKHNQEGDGIWARFNIVIGVNAALLGIVSYIYSAKPRPVMWRDICTVLSLAGCLISLWALYVLHQLWLWHEHWRNLCQRIEQSFPNRPEWPRPHTELPRGLTRELHLNLQWLLPYTQPFIVVFVALWIGAFVLLVTKQL